MALYFIAACVRCYLFSTTILVTLMMEALRFLETSVLTRATWRKSQKTAFFGYLGNSVNRIAIKQETGVSL
jgi:hypothetical protein